MQRMKEIIEILEKANNAYYNDNEEIISNKEYDDLYDELLLLEKKYNIILDNSPTKNVGYVVKNNLEKVEHVKHMLSLNKTKKLDDLKSFLNNKIGLLSWKLDGLTVVIKYKNKKLLQAITRGNGIIGEDITHNVKHFKNLPKLIEYDGELILRGEAIITYSEFNYINEKLNIEKKYKNPRNLCSGTVRQLDSKVSSKRNVIYLVFEIVNIDNINNVNFNNLKSNSLKWLQKQGFQTVEYEIVNKNTIEKYIEEYKNKILNYDIPSDGLVLTFDDITYSNLLGSTSKFPKDSIAFKWKDEIKETKVIELQWNTSRTGLINPTVIFEPVELEGTTVNKASLHNLSIVENLKLGKNDIIKVYKANMIIPQVLENLTCSNNFTIPEKCNICSYKVEIIKQNKTKFIYCPNPNCKAQKLKSISHYVSRDAMNIEGFSEATIDKFIKNNFIENYIDIYLIEKFKKEIISLKNYGEKSYNNLINSIEKSKKCELHNFIYALGINHIGLSNAKLLCKYYDYNINKIKKATLEELLLIEGFGDIISNSLYNYFNNEKNLYMVEKVLKYLDIIKHKKINNDLKNKTFVITGNINKFKNRKELQNIIEKKGGKVTSTVTKNTTYLVNNNIDSNSSKNKKAKELNIKIINEEKLIDILNLNEV